VAFAACSKKKDDPGAPAGGSAVVTDNGSVMVGSGSAMAAGSAGSGSAMAAGSAGSGSAMAAGSGSAIATGSGSGSAVAAGSGSDAGSSAGSGSAAFDFDKLTHDEKADFMKKNVVPAMKVEFQKFDPKKFANFGCKTCHGKDPKASKFKMPTPDLPKLDFAKLEAGKQEPKIAEWMGKVVKPQMAKILNQKEFDPANAKAGGFSCLECHEQKK
jgi:hypothetical protein